MNKINANELAKRMFVLIEGQPFAVLEVAFVSPSARGASTLVKIRVRHLLTQAVQDKTFKAGEKVEEADVEEPSSTFLYADQAGLHFMDDESYEQFSFQKEKLGELVNYLKENMNVKAIRWNGEYVTIDLPAYVDLKVTSAEPALRGDTAGSVQKKAILETGIEANIPMHIKVGDLVRVNTQTGEISGRA